MLTVYKVKGRDQGLEFIFKYNLNGNLEVFEKNCPLDERQIAWLYNKDRFPEFEHQIKSYWMKEPIMRKKFIVEQAPSDLSFEALWTLYNFKVSKQDAQKAFAKLKEIDVLKCFQGLKGYEEYLAVKKVGKAHLSRYINGRYFENEY